MSVAIATSSSSVDSGSAFDRIAQALHLTPSRSRVLMMLPLLVTIICMGMGYAMVLRYEFAVDAGVPRDALMWEQFKRASGLLLLGMGASSFIFCLLVVYAIRSALRRLAEGVERAATGRLDAPLKDVSEQEVGQLQVQIRSLLEGLNGMARDSGMGATILVDMQGRITVINPLVQLLLRVSPEEIIGKPMASLFNRFGEEDNAALVDMLQRSLARREPVSARSIEITVDRGRQVPVRVRTSFLSADGQRQMAIIIMDYDLREIADIRDKIERAARFLTLGSLSAHLAHEIRNPLTSIAGLVELLKDSTPDEQTKRQYIHHIEASAERLNNLIEGLMDFAAVEKCRLSLQSVATVARDVVEGELHESRWRDKQLSLRMEGGSCDALCNRNWLSRALINLLRNAADATPDAGVVTVAVRRDGEWMNLSVHNTGSFIPPADRTRIFEPFHTGKSTGTGLGLSIVQEIVRAHGGQVVVDSDEIEGTCFTIRLPLAGVDEVKQAM